MNNKKLIELEKMSMIIEKTSNYIIELIHDNEKKARICAAYGDLRVFAKTFYDICNLLDNSKSVATAQKLTDTIYYTTPFIDRAIQATLEYMDK